jgi:hypothetical protein
VVLAIYSLRGHGSREGQGQMRTKSQVAWETANRCATLAQEAHDSQEANIMNAYGMRGSRSRKDASRSAFLTLHVRRTSRINSRVIQQERDPLLFRLSARRPVTSSKRWMRED